MKELIDKQLIVKITGAVHQSNIADFEVTALKVVNGINTELQTDDDFAEAEQNIKDCTLVETRLQQAKDDALNETKEISDLLRTIDRLTAKFRDTRLLLNNKVNTEKESRKKEIIVSAKDRLAGMLLRSPVRHGFVIDDKAIAEASKNKRSLLQLKKAVDAVAESEELRLAIMEEEFIQAMGRISSAEDEYPGLFPDKQNLALKAIETVESEIRGRIASYRFELAEKDRKAKEAEVSIQQDSAWQAECPPIPPDPLSSYFTPPPPPSDGKQIKYTLSITVETSEVDLLLAKILTIKGVTGGRVDGFCGFLG